MEPNGRVLVPRRAPGTAFPGRYADPPPDADKSGFACAIATQSPAIARAFFDQLDERARDSSARSRKLVEDRIVVACGQNGKRNR